MLIFLSFLYLFGGLQTSPITRLDTRSMKKDVTIVMNSETSQTLAVEDLEICQSNNNPDSLTYLATKAQIDFIRIRLRNDFEENRIHIDSVKRTFDKQLTDQIIPYWYGTGWSFNGHTAVPNTGKIACGYFISTTLKDMGLNLNRYKLAHKSPIDEAKALSCGTEITTIAHDDPEQALVKIKEYIKKGVYFIGFDTGHVAFLTKKKRETPFSTLQLPSSGLCMHRTAGNC